MGSDDGMDTMFGDHLDDDPTVFADEDLIRQIRADAAPSSEPTSPISNVDGDADTTVVADEAIVHQIRAVAATGTSPTVPVDEDDPTVFADDDVIKEIRQAATTQPTAAVTSAPLPEESSASGTSTYEPIDNEQTVMAGEDVIRELRVGRVSPMSTPAQSVDHDEPPRAQAEKTATEDGAKVIPERTDPSQALEELRQRFAPEVKKPSGSILPPWFLIAGIGLLTILVVIVVAVVFIG